MSRKRYFSPTINIHTVSPFRANCKVPFWGQSTCNLCGVYPKQDCSLERVKNSENTNVERCAHGNISVRSFLLVPTGCAAQLRAPRTATRGGREGGGKGSRTDTAVDGRRNEIIDRVAINRYQVSVRLPLTDVCPCLPLLRVVSSAQQICVLPECAYAFRLAAFLK